MEPKLIKASDIAQEQDGFVAMTQNLSRIVSVYVDKADFGNREFVLAFWATAKINANKVTKNEWGRNLCVRMHPACG
jgi:hypothetical protein